MLPIDILVGYFKIRVGRTF